MANRVEKIKERHAKFIFQMIVAADANNKFYAVGSSRELGVDYITVIPPTPCGVDRRAFVKTLLSETFKLVREAVDSDVKDFFADGYDSLDALLREDWISSHTGMRILKTLHFFGKEGRGLYFPSLYNKINMKPIDIATESDRMAFIKELKLLMKKGFVVQNRLGSLWLRGDWENKCKELGLIFEEEIV